MRIFDKVLQEQIDQLSSTSYVGAVVKAAHEVKEAESALYGLRETLHHAVESLNAYLALEIRKRMPKLRVNLADGKCHINYRSKSLTVVPNVNKGQWDLEPGDFSRGFAKGYSHVLPLSDEISVIAEAVIEYFADHYKTIKSATGNPGNPEPVTQNEPVQEANPTPAPPTGRPVAQKGESKPGNVYYT